MSPASLRTKKKPLIKFFKKDLLIDFLYLHNKEMKTSDFDN